MDKEHGGFALIKLEVTRAWPGAVIVGRIQDLKSLLWEDSTADAADKLT